MIDRFFQINAKSKMANDLFDIINNKELWGSSFDFHIKSIPHYLIDGDEFLKYLYSKLKFKAYIIRINSYTNYIWHKDARRKCSINMLLSDDGKSHCLFSDDTSKTNIKFIELKYQPNTYYIFNNQYMHTVINFDSYRYTFSTEFDDLKVSFYDVYNVVKEYELLISNRQTVGLNNRNLIGEI